MTTHDPSSGYDADEYEFKDFSQQTIDLAQNRIARSFGTGSWTEIRNSVHDPRLLQSIGMNLEESDVDYMVYPTGLYAFTHSQRIPETYNGHVAWYQTQGMHPGYVRLFSDDFGVELDSSLLFEKPTHGPAVLDNSYNRAVRHVFVVDSATVQRYNLSIDMVIAVHSPHWPAEASEWIGRKRLHGCPSKSVIRKVASYGCDFVCISHKFSPYRETGKEWRFSFSQAELIIIENWTKTQKMTYRALKVICKIIGQIAKNKQADSHLCTYYFKTLMLWACEQRQREFWPEHSLVDSVRSLLAAMKDWLVTKHCPNYFIPSNNMMDHLVDIDLSDDIKALHGFSEVNFAPLGNFTHYFRYFNMLDSPLGNNTNMQSVSLAEDSMPSEFIAAVVEFCKHGMIPRNCITKTVELPSWINKSLIIYNYLHNSNYLQKDLMNQNDAPEFKQSVYSELSNLYIGLRYHWLGAASTGDVSLREEYLYKAMEYFLEAADQHQASLSYCVADMNFNEILLESFFSTDMPGVEYVDADSDTDTDANVDADTDADIDTDNDNNVDDGTNITDVNDRVIPQWDIFSRFLKAESNVTFRKRTRKPTGPSTYLTGCSVEPANRHQQVALDAAADNPTWSGNFVDMTSSSSRDEGEMMLYTTEHEPSNSTTSRQTYWPASAKSPTVSISWFISQVYLANLLHTSMQEYQASAEICTDIFRVFKLSSANEHFAERTFSVLLTNDWAGILDQDLQVLIGLCSLMSYLSSSSEKNFGASLKICPIQFCLYLLCRCAIHEDQFIEYKACMDIFGKHGKCFKSFSASSEILKVSLKLLHARKRPRDISLS